MAEPANYSSVHRATSLHPESAFVFWDESTNSEGHLKARDLGGFLGRSHLAAGLVPIANRAGNGGNQSWSDGTVQSATYQNTCTAVSDVSQVRLVFPNYIFDSANTNSISVKASLVDSSGNVYKVFFNGARTCTIEAGGYVISDPVPILLRAGDSFNVRNYVSVSTLGHVWPRNTLASQGLNDSMLNNSDVTDTGAGLAFQFTYVYMPLMVAGETSKASFLVLGDSIGVGQAAGFENLGMFAKGLTGRPYFNASLAGAAASTSNTQTKRLYRLTLIGGDVAIVQLGTNDLVAGGVTTAALQGYLSAIWSDLSVLGYKVYQTTITPRTTSTDTWATVENQTLPSYHAMRVAVNDWIRTSPSPLTGYIEIADVVETARNSGKWAVGMTSDGIHPTQSGHTACAVPIRSLAASL